MKIIVCAGLVLAVVVGGCSSVSTQQVSREESTAKVLQVRQTEDFVISGRGDASAWTKANWERLSIFLNFLVPKLPAPKEEDLSKGIIEAIDIDVTEWKCVHR